VKREFSAPWGNLLKIMSMGITLLLIAIFGYIAFLNRASMLHVTILYIIFPVIVLSTCLLLTVRGYSISEDSLLIKRLFWSTEVSLESLKSVEIDPKAMTGSIKTFGNGGLYSFSGKFRSRKLGSFNAYVTDLKNCVVLKTADRTVVVSPGNPELFVEVLKNRQWN
jgi:hypothetical protein